ncbi:MAG: WD40 repeat domain-containing serine/threonine-protein kinase [Cyanobacteria bacterium J06632_19]
MSYCLNPHCQKPQNPKDDKFCFSCGTALLLKERYRAIKPIGQGGFGRTFLAVDEDKPSKPPCVVKQLLPQAQGTNNTQKAAELFEQEALRLDNLGRHNQIPNLLDYFTQEEYQYLVQEYIDGHNLLEILAEEGNFNETKIYDLLNSLLPVLEFIHQNEVIHRDVKPENIIRSREGKLFLVDFGAAKVVTGTAMLQTGTSIGTPEFVAPEQSRGKAIYSSDLYSLGTTCIFLLTGISPFELFDISENNWIWQQYLVKNPVSDKLSYILDKLIPYATRRRYKSASEVLENIKNKKGFVFENKPYLNNSNWDKIFKIPSWQCINTWYSHTHVVDSIAISLDGIILASGSHDKTVKLWEISTGKQITTLNCESLIYAVAFSPDRHNVAIGYADNNIQIWDIHSGETRILNGHKGWFAGVNFVTFSPDGKILASAGGDKTVKLWDLTTNTEIHTFNNHKKWVSTVAFSPYGKIIASGIAVGTVILQDFGNYSKFNILNILNHNHPSAAIRSIAFSPDKKIIATGSEDSTIKLWEVNTGQEIYTLTGHKKSIRCVTFSPSGKILASSSHAQHIKLWNMNTKQEICTLSEHSDKVNSLGFSPDGKTLFSAGDDNCIKVWQLM